MEPERDEARPLAGEGGGTLERERGNGIGHWDGVKDLYRRCCPSYR